MGIFCARYEMIPFAMSRLPLLSGANLKTEADVIFNSAQPFDSYRGALRYSGSSRIADLRRVAIHEFGHVLA